MSTNKYVIDLPDRKPRPSLALIIAAFVLCLMSSILLHAWSQSNSVVPALQVLLGTAQGPSGIVLNKDGVTVYMPPNATDQQGTISLAAADPDVTLVANDTQWIRPKVVSVEYRRSDGSPIQDIVFSAPLEICFSLNEEQWKSFRAQPDAFQVQFYKEDANPAIWEVLPRTSYPERLQVCGEASHLSVFALAVKVGANVPITGPTLQESTAVPTRTPVPVQTQERNRKKDPTAPAAQPTATNAQQNQPTDIPPTLAPTDTSTPRPTNTPRPPTNTPQPTNTPRPPTNTPQPTNTARPPTNTPQPTSTPRPPTNTPQPTNTSQPTATNPPPTATDVPPTDPPPTATDVPPTDPPPTQEPTQQPTDPPPTDVPPPTEPPTPAPTPATILGLLQWFISPSSP